MTDDALRADTLHALVSGSPVLEPTGSGRLDAIDATVKDLFAVHGHTSSFGHPRWRDTHEPATFTSPVIDRLLSAGARVVGLSKLDQMAFSLVGNVGEGDPPVNPRHPEYFCGGSSSGTASAVAGSRAQLGIGTDTAGSVRVPAAMCGIHGLRPTRGRIDTTGTIALAPSFDTVGLLAAHPQVLRSGFASLVDIHAGAAGPEPISRVLVAPSVTAELPEPARSAIHDAALAVAGVLDTELVAVDVAHLVSPEIGNLLGRLQGREIWAAHGPWLTDNIDFLDDDVALRLRRCRAFATEGPTDIAVDERDWRRFRSTLSEIVPPGTVLVLPVLGAGGPRRTDDPRAHTLFRRQCYRLQAPASLGGFPQLTWTRAVHPDQGPEVSAIGLLAAPGSDEALLDLLDRLNAA